MANKAKSKSREQYSSTYKSTKRMEANRKRKLEKQLKLQPTNEQVRLALKDIHYRRQTPKVRVWSSTWRSTARILKQFTGRFDPDIMSSNPETSKAALQRPGPVVLELQKVKKQQSYNTNNFFALGTRLQGNK